MGVATLVYSLLTRYELGVVKLIPFRTHLWLDVISGIFLAFAPWAFELVGKSYVLFLCIGIFEVIVALFTNRKLSVED